MDLGMPEAGAAAAHDGLQGLKLANVWKRYGGVTAVRDVSFEARRGEVHALLGENGAGKSTLMGIASGDVRPDEGVVEILGRGIAGLNAAQAQALGLAIVHQHPAVMPDLTVAENLVLAVPRRHRRRTDPVRTGDWVRAQLARVGCRLHPKTRMGDVDMAQRQLVELAKALAIDPRVLILDEPTAALTADHVELLFEAIRVAAGRGTAVIYISHRLHEVRRVAQRVTVMRDGEVKGSASVGELSDDDILRLIVGRAVTHTYPPKSAVAPSGTGGLTVEKLSGHGFHEVYLECRPGEVVGIAGITGNGQAEFLRALAGLEVAKGRVTLSGREMRLGRPDAARRVGVTFLSSDRQREGLLTSMSVRENAVVSALPRFAKLGVMDGRAEREGVEAQRTALAVKSASIEANVTSLSGGNQQKVIFARALLSEPSLVLAEDPTAGVDVGARAEIYRILRAIADRGTPVVVVSSDVTELEGLCDRVVVFSRGQIVGGLAGSEVTEAAMARLMVGATSHRRTVPGTARLKEGAGGFRRFLAGDYAPSLILGVLMLALGLYVTGLNARFLSPFNIEKVLLLSAALTFIGLGQMCAVFTGGIDLSVGPLTGLMVVLSSFFFVDDAPAYAPVIGLATMLAVALAVGLFNGVLVRFGNFTAVAATLGVYIILQGISVLLRPFPDGSISTDVIALVQTDVHGIPVAFVAAVLLALGLEVALRKTRWGMSLRAVGSDGHAAVRIGVRSSASVVGAFVACCALTVVGSILVMAQLGIGDPNQGVEYTLASIAAVVLGGASLFGGRGAFVGVLFGAVLIQEVNSATSFMGLSQAWQYWFIGLLTLAAVALYSQARHAASHA